MMPEPLSITTREEVQLEVHAVLEMMGVDTERSLVADAFHAVERLYSGYWPGYRACDTPYHDLEHVMLVTLAMARLMHGAFMGGEQMDAEDACLCIVAALFHDAGLVRSVSDAEAQGAELTSVHVSRGATMADHWLQEQGAGESARGFVQALLSCTELEMTADGVNFDTEERRYLGAILKAADLAGQVADLSYAAKLPLLACELEVAEADQFMGEESLIIGTPAFCRMVLFKLVMVEGKSLLSLSRLHFMHRFSIDADLYTEQIRRQIEFIEKLTDGGMDGYWSYLENGAVKMGCPSRDFGAIFQNR